MSLLLEKFNAQFYGPEEGRRWVFLHGLMGFLNNWRKIISGLEVTERCLAYDQRGHGRSFKPPSGYRSEDYADDLKEILDHLGWDRIVLVGHSMGARNALNFCARYPEQVERFVLEDIGPASDPANPRYYRELLGAVPAPFPDRETAKKFFQGEFQAKIRSRDSADVLAAFFYANMEDRGDGGVDWRFSPSAILQSVDDGLSRDRWDELRALQVPTLLVHGEKSRELSPEIFKKMLDCNKLIQGVTIPGAGHWVHADQPQRFLNEIRRFAGLE